MMKRYKVGYSTIGLQSDWVILEIGGGANPCLRANVITNYEHEKNQDNKVIKNIPNARMIILDMQNMSTFRDKEFDYSICVQSIEHVDSPAKACEEIMRVSKQGYIETPTQLCEALLGWPFHKWLVHISPKNSNKLIFVKKKDIYHKRMDDFFFNMFYTGNPNRQRFQDIINKYSDMWIVKFHWKGKFEYEVVE